MVDKKIVRGSQYPPLQLQFLGRSSVKLFATKAGCGTLVTNESPYKICGAGSQLECVEGVKKKNGLPRIITHWKRVPPSSMHCSSHASRNRRSSKAPPAEDLISWLSAEFTAKI